ncbi:hypothetical protein JOM56_012534 [Amanita muscaria]
MAKPTCTEPFESFRSAFVGESISIEAYLCYLSLKEGPLEDPATDYDSADSDDAVVKTEGGPCSSTGEHLDLHNGAVMHVGLSELQAGPSKKKHSNNAAYYARRKKKRAAEQAAEGTNQADLSIEVDARKMVTGPGWIARRAKDLPRGGLQLVTLSRGMDGFYLFSLGWQVKSSSAGHEEACHWGAGTEMKKAASSLNLSKEKKKHRRGEFPAVTHGISFGGGQEVPRHLKHKKENEEILEELILPPTRRASQAIHMPASKRVKASLPREKGPQASSKQRDIGATIIVPSDGERLSLKPKAAKKKGGSTSAAVQADKAEKQGNNDGEEEISPDDGDDAIKEEEADDDEGDRTTTVINQMDTLCNGSVITICRINLLDPPAKLKFGTWNKRKLVEKRVNTLATEIMTSFRPFAMTSLLPLILPTEAVDPSCINNNLNSENTPFLKLTSKALSSGMKLQFAGGNHRLRATHIVRDRLVKKIRVWKEQINTTERQLNEMAEEGKGR